MKWIIALLCAGIVSCVSHQGYQANSVAEARAYTKRAVEAGIVHKGGAAELLARKSVGKPENGIWDSLKIEKFVSKFTTENPQLVEINLAANKGTISEHERFVLTQQLEMLEAQSRIAKSQAVSSSLNSMSASLNQTTANINQNTALINQRTVNSLNSRTYTPYYSAPLYTPSYSAPIQSFPRSTPLYRY